MKILFSAIKEGTFLTNYIIPISGTIISIGLNLTPGVLFYELKKGQRKLESIPEFMFISNVFNCTLNLAYSIIIFDIILIVSNLACTLITILYSSIYLWYYSEFKCQRFILYLFVAYNLTLEIFYLSTQTFKDFDSDNKSLKENEYAEKIIGTIQIFLGVINAGAPGQKIFTVIKTGNYTLIPIITTIFQCFCSSFWFIYGIVIEKYQIIIPNAIGILLTLFQIIVYFYFYGKNKDKNFNDDDDDNSNNYKDKNDYGRYYDQDSL